MPNAIVTFIDFLSSAGVTVDQFSSMSEEEQKKVVLDATAKASKAGRTQSRSSSMVRAAPSVQKRAAPAVRDASDASSNLEVNRDSLIVLTCV